MKEIELEVILHRLKYFNVNYTKTAKSLGVSSRGLRVKIKTIREEMPDRYAALFEKTNVEQYQESEDFIWRGMATNEERLRYLDNRF